MTAIRLPQGVPNQGFGCFGTWPSEHKEELVQPETNRNLDWERLAEGDCSHNGDSVSFGDQSATSLSPPRTLEYTRYFD